MSLFEKVGGFVGQTIATLKLGMALVLEDASGHTAATGAIRLPNNVAIKQRNAANSADYSVVTVDGSNNVTFGDATAAGQGFLRASGTVNLVSASGGVILQAHDSSTVTLDGAGSMQLGFPLSNLTFLQGVVSPTFGQQVRLGDAATNDLTISAQGAFQTGTPTNKNGGNLVLKSGVSTAAGTGVGGAVSIVGAQKVTQVSKSAAYTADAGSATSDYVVLLTGNANTQTLPAASAGRVIIYKDAAGNAATQNKTLTPASGTIDGAGTYVLNVNNASVTLMSDGTNWFVIGEYNGTVI